MSDITSVYLFYYDPVFVDRDNIGLTALETTGISKLNQLGLSYFVDLHRIKDIRKQLDRPTDWASVTSPTLLVDNYWYSEFINIIDSASDNDRNSIFSILDRVFFNKANDTDNDTYLSTTDKIKDVYVKGSLKTSTKYVDDNYFINNDSVHYQTSPLRIFTISLTKDKITYKYQIHAFIDGAYWNETYPNSWIQRVSPPVNYHDLLYMDFMKDTGKTLSIATNTANLIGTNIVPAYAPTDIPSGYLNYDVVLHDSVDNKAVATFTLIYKGCVPSQHQIRDKIKDEVINSGEGSEDEWKDRIPSLFIEHSFYVVPFWDNTITQADKIIYPGSVTVNDYLNKIELILPDIDATIINNKLDVAVAAYEKLFMYMVPIPTDLTKLNEVKTFHELLPDYQAYSSIEPNFNYMQTNTKNFIKDLTEVLTMLLENKTNPLYKITTDKSVEYAAFVIDEVEYCIITPTYFASALRG